MSFNRRRKRKSLVEAEREIAGYRRHFQRERLFIVLLIPALVPIAIGLEWIFWRSYKRKGFGCLTRSAFNKAFCVWAFHVLRFRKDEVGAQLFLALPGSSRVILLPIKLCLLMAKWVSGFDLSHKVHSSAHGRVHRIMSELSFFDNCVLQADVEQLVVVGGGFSALGLNDSILNGRIRAVFELNEKRVHHAKRKLLKAAQVSCQHVKLIATKKPIGTNFGWIDQLKEEGFQTSKSSLFVIDGQMKFWQPQFVESMMDDIGHEIQVNNETQVALMYVDESKVESLSLLRTPFSFGLPDDEQEEWIKRFGPMKTIAHERLESAQIGFMLCAFDEASVT